MKSVGNILKKNDIRTAVLVATAGEYGGVATHLNHFYTILSSLVKIKKVLLFSPDSPKFSNVKDNVDVCRFDSRYSIYSWISGLRRFPFMGNFIYEFFCALKNLRGLSCDYMIISSHDPMAFWGFSFFAAKVDYYLFVLPGSAVAASNKISAAEMNLWLLRAVVKFIDRNKEIRYFVQTEAGADLWSRVIGVSKTRMTILPNPPFIVREDYSLISDSQQDSDSLEPILNKVKNGSKLILSIGHLVEYKNPSAWVECALNSVTTCHDYVYVWVGDGPLHEKIRQKVRGHKSIFLLGRLNQSDIRILYKNSWLFFHPALEESQGIVIFDALAFGIPVILNKTEILRGLIEEKEVGFCIDCSRENVADEFSEKLKLLSDSHYWSRCAKNAIELFEGDRLHERWILRLTQEYLSVN